MLMDSLEFIQDFGGTQLVYIPSMKCYAFVKDGALVESEGRIKSWGSEKGARKAHADGEV